MVGTHHELLPLVLLRRRRKVFLVDKLLTNNI